VFDTAARACTPPRHADVVVVGAGLFGTSIAFELARRGCPSLALVDRRTVASGDSGVSFGMIRSHYSNETTARLAMRGARMIQHWADEVGEGGSGYTQTGYLLTATDDQVGALRDNVTRLQDWGLETSFVSPATIAELEPLLRLEGIVGGAWEPGGGFADPLLMNLSWFTGAVRRGVVPTLDTAVQRLVVSHDRVAGVETSAGTIAADAVVLATGSWSSELLAGVGVEIPIELRRIQVGVVRQHAGRPVVRVTFVDGASNLVMRPDRAERALVVAYQPVEHLKARDECAPDADLGYADAVRRVLEERVPAYATAEWVGGFAGAYDGTPDWNPVLGWAPGVDGLYLALGSGHGFKLAPAVGEAVAEEVLGRASMIDLTPLRAQRFERGELLPLAYGPAAGPRA
jgi:glycine/D-amino acid oxidase-like deaminating enzyme